MSKNTTRWQRIRLSFFRTAGILSLLFLGSAGLPNKTIASMTDKPSNPSFLQQVFFGTSAGRDSGSEGIYQTTFDPETGSLGRPAELAARIHSPGFLCQHPTLPVLYSTGQDPESRENIIASFTIETIEGKSILKPLNQVPTGCGNATHLAADPTGTMLVTAQYGAGTVAAFPLNKDGSLQDRSDMFQLTKATKVDSRRQEAPHPHSVTIDPSGGFALVADLGADAVYVFRLEKDTASIPLHAEAATPPGSGPRHLKFSKNGRFVHVLNELSLSIDTFAWNPAEGNLSRIGTLKTLPDAVKNREKANTASEIQVHPNGRFVYAGNRGNDSLSVFSADPETGSLELLEIIPTRTAWPRHFSIDPGGQWLVCAGQDSFNVGVFSIDPDSGRLTYVPQSSIAVPSPICVHFVSR